MTLSMSGDLSALSFIPDASLFLGLEYRVIMSR